MNKVIPKRGFKDSRTPLRGSPSALDWGFVFSEGVALAGK